MAKTCFGDSSTDDELEDAEELSLGMLDKDAWREGWRLSIYVRATVGLKMTPKSQSDIEGAQELGVGSCIVLWDQRMHLGCTYPIRCECCPPTTSPYPRILELTLSPLQKTTSTHSALVDGTRDATL